MNMTALLVLGLPLLLAFLLPLLGRRRAKRGASADASAAGTPPEDQSGSGAG